MTLSEQQIANLVLGQMVLAAKRAGRNTAGMEFGTRMPNGVEHVTRFPVKQLEE